MKMKQRTRDKTKRWVLALAPWVVVLGGLSACTGQQAGVPPAARSTQTDRSPEALAGSPVVAATPLPSCDAYAAWVSDPGVRAAVEKMALWPEVIAEVEKAARGEPVDQEHARRLFDQLGKVAHSLRETDVAAVNPETTRRAARAMGLSARLAESLGHNQLDQTAAAAALVELRQDIAGYEDLVAAEKAHCG
jgi:hypothetical protein